MKRPHCRSAVFFLLIAGTKEFNKEWARIVRAALEFRMELNTYVELAFNFYGFYKSAVRAGSADYEACFLHLLAEVVVELVAVAVALADVL